MTPALVKQSFRHAFHLGATPSPKIRVFLQVFKLLPLVPIIGQIFLGNSNDVPSDDHAYCPHLSAPDKFLAKDHPFAFSSNDPVRLRAYDICIKCHDTVPFTFFVHLRAAEEHIATLDDLWAERCRKQGRIVPRPASHEAAELLRV